MRHDCVRHHHNCIRKREAYTIEDFIKAVYARPMLWQRHHTDYHNRDKRELVWNEVATCLYSNYDDMTTAEKQKIVELLTKRWKNTRDSFFRAQRRNRKLNGKHVFIPHPRAYIYQKELNFLLHNQDKDSDKFENEVGSDDSNEANTKSPDVSKDKHEEDPIIIESDDDDDDADADASHTPSGKKRRLVEKTILTVEKLLPTVSCDPSNSNEVIDVRRKKTSNNNQEYSKAAFSSMATKSASLKKKRKERATSTPSKPSRLAEKPKTAESDPDQSFFDSIKPVIQNMSMDRKLDFQIEILKLLKNFRCKQ